ncbi:MAG: twin-arginine translocase subunit TatC [Armatimonadetes bacterium]|nr:twin-arginine translocase subunit TatC [Armatimonadota bacterium]
MAADGSQPRPEEHDDDRRMELSEHLAELRTRIVRSMLYAVAGSISGYYLFDRIYRLLYSPMSRALGDAHVDFKIAFSHFMEPFFVVLQISIVAGLIMVSPLIILEMWGFIRPALTRRERRPLRWIVPLSVTLFIAGVLLAYWIAQFAMSFFLEFVPLFPKAVLYQGPKTYVLFMLKLMGIFGVVFQMPVVLMFLGWTGLLKSAAMKRSWRHAIVGISFLGLLITPSNDAFTMLMMVVPVFGLYLGSIGLVRIIERKREAGQTNA